jgi:hypothetical protein
MDSIASPKVTTTKGKGVRARSLVRNTLGVERCAGAPGWGLGRLTSKLSTHMDLHKPNKKLVSVKLDQFWCMDEPWANTDS